MPKKRRVAIDAKNKQSNFLKNDFLEFFKSEVSCHTIGRVISYDKAHRRCDVQPLPLPFYTSPGHEYDPHFLLFEDQ